MSRLTQFLAPRGGPGRFRLALASIGVVASLALITNSLWASPVAQAPAPAPTTPPAAATGPQALLPAPSQWITVAGDGEARGAPDTAQVVLGVVQVAPTSNEALAATSDQLAAAIAAAKALGMENNDIQTSGLVLQPIYRNRPAGDTSPPEVQAYRSSNNVTLTIRDIGKTGEILGATTGSGANTVNGVRFIASNLADLRAQALADAVRNARKNAAAMATAAGVRVDGIWTIVEEEAPAPVPRTAEAAFAVAPGASVLPVQPGELTVRARVSATFSVMP